MEKLIKTQNDVTDEVGQRDKSEREASLKLAQTQPSGSICHQHTFEVSIKDRGESKPGRKYQHIEDKVSPGKSSESGSSDTLSSPKILKERVRKGKWRTNKSKLREEERRDRRSHDLRRRSPSPSTSEGQKYKGSNMTFSSSSSFGFNEPNNDLSDSDSEDDISVAQAGDEALRIFMTTRPIKELIDCINVNSLAIKTIAERSRNLKKCSVREMCTALRTMCAAYAEWSRRTAASNLLKLKQESAELQAQVASLRESVDEIKQEIEARKKNASVPFTHNTTLVDPITEKTDTVIYSTSVNRNSYAQASQVANEIATSTLPVLNANSISNVLRDFGNDLIEMLNVKFDEFEARVFSERAKEQPVWDESVSDDAVNIITIKKEAEEGVKKKKRKRKKKKKKRVEDYPNHSVHNEPRE